jgi:hypothetical protein
MLFGGFGVPGGFGEEVAEVRSAKRLFHNGGTEVQRLAEAWRFKRR